MPGSTQHPWIAGRARNDKPGTRNDKPGTRNDNPGTRNDNSGTRNDQQWRATTTAG